MSLYTEPSLKLDFHEIEIRWAYLLEEIRYEAGHKGSGRWIVVPAGFRTDGVTIPRALWWFVPPWGSKAAKAAIIHDYLLYMRAIGQPLPGFETRRAIDDEFHTALLAIGVSRRTAAVAWAGVSAFSLLKEPSWPSATRASSPTAPSSTARSSPSSPA